MRRTVFVKPKITSGGQRSINEAWLMGQVPTAALGAPRKLEGCGEQIVIGSVHANDAVDVLRG